MDMSLSDENVQGLSHFHPQKNKPMKISKRDMHNILDSYTDQAIDMFEQKLNQNMINLLEKKVELMQKEMEVKWKEVYFSAAEKMQLRQEIENKQEEMNQLLAELQEFKKAQSECPSGERGNRSEEIQFDILERSADVASTSGNQGMRENTLEEIQFDILERTADVAPSSDSQERAKVEFHVERDDNAPDMDLELCLGFPCWKLQKR